MTCTHLLRTILDIGFIFFLWFASFWSEEISIKTILSSLKSLASSICWGAVPFVTFLPFIPAFLDVAWPHRNFKSLIVRVKTKHCGDGRWSMEIHGPSEIEFLFLLVNEFQVTVQQLRLDRNHPARSTRTFCRDEPRSLLSRLRTEWITITTPHPGRFCQPFPATIESDSTTIIESINR